MYEAYINERYTEKDMKPFSIKEVAKNFEKLMEVNGRKILSLLTGFVTYEFCGDAVLIYDIYIKPEYRGTKQARKIHDVLIETARNIGKRVAIAIAEHDGINQQLGLTAIKAGGWLPSYQLEKATIFVKGI
jgi:L-amino acid N-acyltransferase YncA